MLSDTDTDPETDSEIDSDADTLTDSDSEVLSTFDKLSERLIEIDCLLGSSVKGTVTVLEVLSLNTTVISPVDETEKDLESLDEISRELTSLNFSHTCFFSASVRFERSDTCVLAFTAVIGFRIPSFCGKTLIRKERSMN